jgi:hypothetical protein
MKIQGHGDFVTELRDTGASACRSGEVSGQAAF